MTEKFTRFDPVDHLQSEEDMAMYLDACLEEDPGDGSVRRRPLAEGRDSGGAFFSIS